jgi:uncharacterized RDD family membrane protein YckC
LVGAAQVAWYYADKGQRKGPVDEAELDDLVRAGVVRNETLVWQAGMPDWQPHSAARGAIAVAPPPPLAAGGALHCVECGRPFSTDELVVIGSATVCAVCKPIYMQRLREHGSAVGPVRYGGFWIRFVARLIDSVLLGIVGAVVQLPLNLAALNPAVNTQDPRAVLPALMGAIAISSGINLVIAATYETLMVVKWGGTLGKLALDLRVVRPDGFPLTVGRALGRYFATIVSSVTLSIGYIIAAFDDEKRSLHDRICDTRVIKIK